ncbi:MAG: DNA polymerase III subunit delta', partial [Paracoccaceae bacterium]|nr:DNA polymerase III subunit delta' [Paracoccaceae bacterium]
ELSAGSVGAAIRLLHLEGLALYGDLVALFCGLPNFDRARVLKLAEMAGERGNEESFDMLLTLLDIFLARLARCGVTGQMPKVEIITGEFEILRRAAPDLVRGRAWAEIAQQITSRVQHGRAVNLDPAALILDTFFKMEKTALG